MKKLMSILLGLALVIGCSSFALADEKGDKKEGDKKEVKKKKAGKKKAAPVEEKK